MVKSYVLGEKSAGQVLNMLTEWEFPLREMNGGKGFDVCSCYVLCMVHSRANVLV
jgi:hypothetical protein